ncbi:MAG: PA0069 family radical SAM protein [Bacteroidia bacterium]|nr:PA0069 family radical SAM protein [Bacteroidia bacterium]
MSEQPDEKIPPSRKLTRGRGSGSNPRNRFESIRIERDSDYDDSEDAPIRTQFLRDDSKSVIAYNTSPDIGFEASINPYRGCEHGCTYCYARPFHEYLGFSAGLDFETRILVKEKAPELLRRELGSASWKPRVLELSGVTDPYQPVERALRVTRGCLEVLAECRNPVQIITKNDLICRDSDLLSELARYQAAAAVLSITTLDTRLARALEPRTSTPERRLEAISRLSEAGIPTGVSISPVIPALTDEEMPRILAEAARHGASFAFFIPLRLPHAVASLFTDWLEVHLPDRKEKILNRIKSMRGGALNDARFGSRMRGQGIHAEQFRALFHAVCRKEGLDGPFPQLSTGHFRRPAAAGQLRLF